MKLHEKISLDKYINKLTIDRLEQDRKHFYGDLNKENILRKSIIYPQLIVFTPSMHDPDRNDSQVFQKIAHYCQINPDVKKNYERVCYMDRGIEKLQNEMPGPISPAQIRMDPLPKKEKEKRKKKEPAMPKIMTKKKIKVYIASPYTIGDIAMNVKLQIDTVDQLINLGFVPFAPLYYHFQHMMHPRSSDDWMALDLEWLDSCDAVLRLPGASFGADREVECAESKGKPIFMDVESLIETYIQPGYIRPPRKEESHHEKTE